jgi:hypothetical protein
MKSIWLIAAAAVALVIIGLLIWLITTISKLKGNSKGLMGDAPEKAVETIFDNSFREELRNRGRLHFEKIISDSAMFLQQDLRLTSSQLSEHIKNVITSKLQEEINNYGQTVRDAKTTAIEAIQRTNAAIDEQRKALGQQVQTEIAAEKARAIDQFEKNMADIINHYMLEVVGSQIDLSDQMEFILADLEKNKQAIVEDLKNAT